MWECCLQGRLCQHRSTSACCDGGGRCSGIILLVHHTTYIRCDAGLMSPVRVSPAASPFVTPSHHRTITPSWSPAAWCGHCVCLRTVKVWKGAKCTRTLEGHSGPVLSLAILPTGGFVTGSGGGA